MAVREKPDVLVRQQRVQPVIYDVLFLEEAQLVTVSGRLRIVCIYTSFFNFFSFFALSAAIFFDVSFSSP